MAHGSDPALYLFLCDVWAKNGFTFLDGQIESKE